MKVLVSTNLGQYQVQMANQYNEYLLKKTMLFDYIFKNINILLLKCEANYINKQDRQFN